jgi:hypothetical protein
MTPEEVLCSAAAHVWGLLFSVGVPVAIWPLSVGWLDGEDTYPRTVARGVSCVAAALAVMINGFVFLEHTAPELMRLFLR